MLINELMIETELITQDKFIKGLRNKNIPAKIYLINGIALQGFIDSIDNEVLILKIQHSNLTWNLQP